jgi:bifunctional ADP-heptose synthase (sugar kinase/adenylyltransferase)
MDIRKIREILKSIRSVSIGVLGDFCLDAYWFLDDAKSEISLETGKATRPVSIQKYSLGGAGNVANNLISIGVGDVRVYGVAGDDPFGAAMAALMKTEGIKTDNLIVQKDQWSTHVYIKPFLGEAEQNRIDFGNFNVLSGESADRLIERLMSEASELDAVIINQQVISGIHTEYFRKRLSALISFFPEKIFIADSRHYAGSYTGAYRKMNDSEAVRLSGMHKAADERIFRREILDAGKNLFRRFGKPVFITCGAHGSVVTDKNGSTEVNSLMVLSRIDTVGAGDSYLAGVTAALAAGHDLENSALTGTLTAGVTIRKLFQTGTATPGELISAATDAEFIHNPELAENISQALYHNGTGIEIINKTGRDILIKHAIFDHDGTISTLREGWEHIMRQMMTEAILGRKYHKADDVLMTRVSAHVDEFIDKTTGVQTLAQMKGLQGMVREFGCVEKGKILDEFGYKKIYNNELLKMVSERVRKLTAGELSVDDFTVKNSVRFLEKLHDNGIKLYLASGSDEEDVINEAGIMGYRDLFSGGIFGSVGDINKDAKKIVLDRILDSIGRANHGQIITFGDGPVEIRETGKRGGVTVGVASDEIKRYGLNMKKRTRLVMAGADMIIPDFSQMPYLLEILNLK